MLENNTLAYSKEFDIIGSIGEVSFLKGTVTIVDENKDLHTTTLEKVVILEEVGTFESGTVIYDHDVLGSVDGKLYEIELQKDKQNVQMHLLDSKLERVQSGEVINKVNLTNYEKFFTLVGNFYELEVEDTVDFNVVIVKDYNGEHFTYFYACNNKEKEEVDLIKVLYFGSTLLEEEEYERRTLSYEVYLDSVEQGTLKEVTPRELNLYVSGAKSFEEDVYEEQPQNPYDSDDVEDDIVEEDFDIEEYDCEEEPKEEKPW